MKLPRFKKKPVRDGFDGHSDLGVGFTHHDDSNCCECPCRDKELVIRKRSEKSKKDIDIGLMLCYYQR